MNIESLSDLFQFILRSKKYWLIPLIVVLLAIGLLLLFAGNAAVAPFIYTMF